MQDLYRQLIKYGMDKAENIHKRLERIPEHRLATFIQEYEEIARNQPLVLKSQFGATNIFPDSRSDPLPENIIRQLAIYSRRIYVHDPLLIKAHEWQHLDQSIPYVMQFPDRKDRIAQFKSRLADEIEKLLILKPLVNAGIVHVTPSELVQFTKAPGELYASDFYGPDSASNEALGSHKTINELPPEIQKYCQEHLHVQPAKYIDNKPEILHEPLSPRNMISIGFPNEVVKFLHLFDVSPVASDTDEKRINMHFDTSHAKQVNPGMFENWINGTKYEYIKEIIDRLKNDLLLSNMAHAKFVTSLGATRDLASLNLSSAPDKLENKVISALLRFELPYFEHADFTSIAKARQNEAAFIDFTIAFDKAFREIEALPHTADFQVRVEEIYLDLLSKPLANISRQMQILKRNLFLDAMVLIGSLTATFVTQGNNLVTAASILAATKAAEMYKTDKSKEDEVKQLPSFFYWDATQ